MLLANAKTIIFDCDGVIFDSNRVKSAAFRQSVEGESPAAIEAFMRYHEAHGGVSRFKKFEWFFRDHLKRQDWERFSQAATERFGRAVRQKLLAAALVPGAEALLTKLHLAGTPCSVVSGGAEEEVQWLLAERGMSGYFQYILGSPNTKRENLAHLQRQHALHLPGVFIGDAASDLEAAQAFGLQFIFVSGYSLWSDGKRLCAEAGAHIVHDLTAL